MSTLWDEPEDTNQVFRQGFFVDKNAKGKVGYLRREGTDFMQILVYDNNKNMQKVLVPVDAVPALLKLMVHAWVTKNKDGGDAFSTYSFERMKEEE